MMSFLPSSTCSSSTMVKCYWTEELERALIAFYSENECLWNKRSENHNNRQLRQKLLESLSSQLSDHAVSFSVDDIKCKFKNLRTVFNRENKAVQANRASDKFYVSKWKHYQQLLFLCESYDEEESLDNLQILARQEEKDIERGNHMTSSTPSSFSSSPSDDVKSDNGSLYRVFLSASPDSCKPGRQMVAPTVPASSSTSQLDTRACTNQPSLKVSTPGSVHPDSRLSGDSRCHWSDVKVQQLISFYSEHSCLWNHKSESYRNRLLKQSLLEMLSSLLSESEPVPFTVEDIKTKFRNLRTIFQREHKAVNSNKTCGSEDFYLPKWKHYRDLMFLCDSCDEEELQDTPLLNLTSQAPPPSLHYHSNTQTATKLNIQLQTLEPPPSPTPPDSQHLSPYSSPSTSSSHPDSRGRKRASGDLLHTSSEVLDFMRTLCQSEAPSPHAGFLKYVEECLNETPADKVKKLKKRIIDMIHSVSEEV